MDTVGQTSIFELDPELAEYERVWIAAQGASGPPTCSMCHRPVHSEAATTSLLGECCAAKIGRAVFASRALRRAAREANGTRTARRAKRRTLRIAAGWRSWKQRCGVPHARRARRTMAI